MWTWIRVRPGYQGEVYEEKFRIYLSWEGKQADHDERKGTEKQSEAVKEGRRGQASYDKRKKSENHSGCGHNGWEKGWNQISTECFPVYNLKDGPWCRSENKTRFCGGGKAQGSWGGVL